MNQPPSWPRPMARPYHKGNVAEDLRLATLRILQNERLEDLSVRRLTREVRVAPANFYNHYASLNMLLVEIAADCLDDFSDMIGHIAHRSASRHDALKRTVTHYVEFACRHTQLYRMMFGYLTDTAQHPRYSRAAQRTFNRLRDLMEAEEFPCAESADCATAPAGEGVAHTGYCIFAMSHGLAGMIAEGHIPLEQQREDSIRTFVAQILDLFTTNRLLQGHAPAGMMAARDVARPDGPC
ncbi:TetR/AcrR family transcriptional regulator [Komagataeibacter sp. FNDCR1]|nr:TetR/AcrR family transcriptional regulator [Komagataeibacter sp. FNDCR1]